MIEKGDKLKEIKVTTVLLVITFTVGLILAVIKFSEILGFLQALFNMIQPFLIGIALAYIFNIPYTKIYKHLPKSLGKKRRWISITCSVFLILFVLVSALWIVIPQVSQNFGSLIETFPQFQEELTQDVEKFLASLGIGDSVVTTINQYMNDIQTFAINFVKGLVPTVISTTINIGSFFVSSTLAIVTAVYTTASKDRMIRQLNRVLFSLLPTKFYNKVLHAGKVANSAFTSFIGGQMIESAIVGLITYFVSVLTGMPFAPLLGIVVGLTNIIPYFGPFIGMSICAFLILFINPMQALWFLAQGTIIQQIESNLIYPRVVGNSVGLSGFWTLVGITIGGGFFGLVGMVMGLPTFATIYVLFTEYIRNRFQKKYQDLKSLDVYPEVRNTFMEYQEIEQSIIMGNRKKRKKRQNKDHQ